MRGNLGAKVWLGKQAQWRPEPWSWPMVDGFKNAGFAGFFGALLPSQALRIL